MKPQIFTRYFSNEQESPIPLYKHLTVCLVGRPNVGKSTLYNRLVGKKDALVHKTAGTTRDRKEGIGKIGDLKFTVIDTGGYEDICNKDMY